MYKCGDNNLDIIINLVQELMNISNIHYARNSKLPILLAQPVKVMKTLVDIGFLTTSNFNSDILVARRDEVYKPDFEYGFLFDEEIRDAVYKSIRMRVFYDAYFFKSVDNKSVF
jgi:hypothetical protein